MKFVKSSFKKTEGKTSFTSTVDDMCNGCVLEEDLFL